MPLRTLGRWGTACRAAAGSGATRQCTSLATAEFELPARPSHGVHRRSCEHACASMPPARVPTIQCLFAIRVGFVGWSAAPAAIGTTASTAVLRQLSSALCHAAPDGPESEAAAGPRRPIRIRQHCMP